MKRAKRKKKLSWQTLLGFLVPIIIGFAGGVFASYLDDKVGAAPRASGSIWISLAGSLLWLYIVVIMQIIIHEAGHLLFGLMSGYRFSSFRVASFMLVKENGQFYCKRLSIAGTGGQCLMIPPAMQDGKIPYVLYNLGGSILNLLSALVLGLLWFCFPDIPYFSAGLQMFALVGILFALLNGIPLRTAAVDNDGYNAISLGKNKAALRAFWIQMQVVASQSQGLRLKDMPAEWFAFPSDEEMKNGMTAAIGVFACNRLMDEENFDEAARQMERLLALDSAIAGVHRGLLICDQIYCELIGENRADVIQEFLDKSQKKFMRSMKNFPSVLRTQYALALLLDKNISQAEAYQKQFEKVARTYPYTTDITSERKLMELAEQVKSNL